jgi:hypothetical protein
VFHDALSFEVYLLPRRVGAFYLGHIFKTAWEKL